MESASVAKDLEGLVVIADDEPSVRFVLERAVSSSGLTAAAVSDGGEIWPILETEHVRALVLDLNMPGMNGWEVLRRIRSDFRDRIHLERMQIIVVSAQSDTRSRELALALGADCFFGKPVDLDALTRSLLRAPSGPSGDADSVH